jgi:hypothetical protein
VQAYNQEKEVLMKLRNEEGKLFHVFYMSVSLGYPQILDSGYDEDLDLFYIAMNKLDEDLNTIVHNAPEGKLHLQSVINIGLTLVMWCGYCLTFTYR